MGEFFSNDDKALRNSIARMVQEAHSRSNYNHSEAEKLLLANFQLDPRIQARGIDPERLLNMVKDKAKSGVSWLDFDDPVLKPNGQRRPLSR